MRNQISGALPGDLKVRNRMLILEILKDGEAYTATDISAFTGISRPTVMKSIQHFIETGLVISEGKGASTESGGKKPELFRFACNKVLLTITLWPELFKLTLCQMNARKIATYKAQAPMHQTPQAAFDFIEEKALQLLDEHNYSIDDLYGVSLSTAGIVDYEHGILKYSSISPEWGNNIELRKYLTEIFGDKVELVIENAGKVTGRAELALPDSADKRILVLFSTWGFSACFIEKGHVLNGQNSLIGEVGHMIIDPSDTERCGCGSHGCAERLISRDRIYRLIHDRKKAHPDSPLLQIPRKSFAQEQVFAQSKEGDSLAREIVAYLAETFAHIIRNISLVFDPDMVVFQGDYSNPDDYFTECLKKNLSTFQYYPETNPFMIKFDNRNLEDLEFIGATQYLQQRFFKEGSLYL